MSYIQLQIYSGFCGDRERLREKGWDRERDGGGTERERGGQREREGDRERERGTERERVSSK